jgi:hypothetical protein
MASIKNLVHQTTATTGTGPLTLAAVNGKQTFAGAFGFGAPTDVFYYFAFNRNAPEWERGTGHMSDATTLVRDTIIESTNSNAAVSFTAGTIDVTNDLPAENQVNADDLGSMAGEDAADYVPVTRTVNGHALSGDVTVTKSDIGLGSVTNDAQLKAASNLSDLANAGTARTNLGVAIGSDVQAYDADLASWAGVTRASGFDTWVASPTSANLRALMTDETGTGALLFAGGAMGTPSSITLTNGTGLPVAGLVGDTSTALGVGSIELGHASDTTLSRSSAGVLAVEGAIVRTAGKETIWIPAAAMVPKATNGCGQSTYDSGASDVTILSCDFDTTTQEYAHFTVGMPKGWNEGTVTFIPYWTNTGGSSTQTVVWSLAGRALSDDDAINGSFGTVQTSSDTWLAQNDLHIGPESSAITIGGSPAENDMVTFEVSRVVGSDNMSGDANLIGLKLLLTYNAANDA